MKKTIIAAALMLASFGASATEIVKVSFDLSKNDTVIQSASIHTMDGEGTDHRHGDEIGYVKNAEEEGDQLTLTPGKAETGLTMKVTAKVTSADKIQMTVTGKQVELISMDEKKLTKSGLTVQEPILDEHNIDLSFTAKDGEKKTFEWTSQKTNSHYVLHFSSTVLDKTNLAIN